MKLTHFEHKNDYTFILTFMNDEQFRVNLYTLISSKVTLNDLQTACIDSDWGCLEFNNGLVDIEPKTLYKFACTYGEKLFQSA